jgi:hypothetical protein
VPVAAAHQPQVTYTDYDEMLADPLIDAVIRRDRRSVPRIVVRSRSGRDRAADGLAVEGGFQDALARE